MFEELLLEFGVLGSSSAFLGESGKVDDEPVLKA